MKLNTLRVGSSWLSFHLVVISLLSFGVTLAAGWAWTKADRPPGVSSPTFSPPPQVSGHVAVSSPGIPSIFLFGGLTGPAGSPVTDSLYEYDVGGWREITEKKGPLAKTPRQRMYSASCILEDESDSSLYLFGGWDPGTPGSGGEFLNDVWKLDLVTKEWQEVGTELPFPVSRHSACTVGNMIVIHTYQGVLVFQNDDSGRVTLVRQETTGDCPEGLSMCAQVPLGNTGVLIFGGSTKTQQLSNDAYYLDTTKWKWTRLSNVGEAPCARASPCAAAAHDTENQAVIFGGASIGSTGYEGGKGLVPLGDTWLVTVDKAAGTAQWTQIVVTGVGPEARLAATLTCIYGEGGKRMLLQGGYDSTAKHTFRDPWILRLEE
jgi:hypothetical protein